MRKNNRERGNNFNSSFGDFNRGFGSRSFGPREMHKAKCAECGKDCEVPFKPTEGKPVYCKECYRKKKQW